MRFWNLTTSSPTGAAAATRRAEEAGWDGVLVVDSQNLSGDAYIALTAWCSQWALTPEFIEQFAIVGAPDHCIERLQGLEAMGIDKVVVVGPTAGVDRDAAIAAERLLAREVLPVLRR